MASARLSGMLPAVESRLIEKRDDLLPLEEAWNRLCLSQRRPNPMLSWDWVITWWKVYGEDDPSASLAVQVWTDGTRLRAALPLYRRQTESGPLFRLIGTGEDEADAVCADHLGLLLDPDADGDLAPEIAGALAGLLRHRRDTLFLTDLSAEEPAIGRLIAAFRNLGFRTRRSAGSACPYLVLLPTFDEQFDSFSPHFRSQYRQTFRFWQGQPDPAVEWHDRTGTLDSFWEDLVRLHQARWENSGKPGVFASRRFRAFHREILSCFHRRGWLLAGSLRSGGKAIAANYGFQMGNALFTYQTGTDVHVSNRLSGGVLLHVEVIRRGIAEGRKEYDFMRGEDAYKHRFTRTSRSLVHLEVARPSLSRTAGWWKESLKGCLRPAYHKLLSR